MSPESFVYWLNGYFELSGSNSLTDAQVKVVKEHLALALTKVTPAVVEPPNQLQPLIVPREINWPQSPWYNPPITQPLITCSTSAPTTQECLSVPDNVETQLKDPDTQKKIDAAMDALGRRWTRTDVKYC